MSFLNETLGQSTSGTNAIGHVNLVDVRDISI